MRLSATCRRITRRYWGAINELDNNRAFGTLITSEGHDCNNLGFGIFLLLNPKNGVAEINWHVIISANSNGAQTGFQIAYDLTDGTKAYIRKQASGIWSEWRHFNTSEILSNLTTTNKSSLVDAINELNSKPFLRYEKAFGESLTIKNVRAATHGLIIIEKAMVVFYLGGSINIGYTVTTSALPDGITVSNSDRTVTIKSTKTQMITCFYAFL